MLLSGTVTGEIQCWTDNEKLQARTIHGTQLKFFPETQLQDALHCGRSFARSFHRNAERPAVERNDITCSVGRSCEASGLRSSQCNGEDQKIHQTVNSKASLCRGRMTHGPRRSRSDRFKAKAGAIAEIQEREVCSKWKSAIEGEMTSRQRNNL